MMPKTAAIASLFALAVCGVAYFVMSEKGLDKTVASLGSVLGILAFILLALLTFVALLSIPVTMVLGVIGLISFLKNGKGFPASSIVAILASTLNLLFWIRYGGLPVK
jgi:hypothetical protein